MKKLKVCVYAICKNESMFVNRWYESMKEADDIYVLDTGSTDDSVSLMEKLGIHVDVNVITPWRFDVARNLSLEMVPEDTDICVCTDLDEVFTLGWRKKLEKVWLKNKLTQIKYLYHWSFDLNGNPATTFHIEKIHSREGYFWKHPVHEVITCKENFEGNSITTDSFVLNHYPDSNKSRASYLPLLEMSVEEDPDDDRNMHYLGREYMYYQRYDECIAMLHRHLKAPKALWKDERSASMRYIARSYYEKGFLEEAEMWFKNAISEAPYLREGYIELARMYSVNKDFNNAYELMEKAFEIKNKSESYINEASAWDYQFYDLFSFVSFYSGHLEEAYIYVCEANRMNPEDTRIEKNVEVMKNAL